MRTLPGPVLPCGISEIPPLPSFFHGGEKLTVEGELTVERELTVEEELTVEGELTVEKELTVEGELTAERELTVKGELTVERKLTVDEREKTERKEFVCNVSAGSNKFRRKRCNSLCRLCNLDLHILHAYI